MPEMPFVLLWLLGTLLIGGVMRFDDDNNSFWEKIVKTPGGTFASSYARLVMLAAAASAVLVGYAKLVIWCVRCIGSVLA
jgi:hypothetical protein